jgi:profilin
MHWKYYVDQLIASGRVKEAAICGLNGDVWAQSDNFAVSKEEVIALLCGMEFPSQLYTYGVYVADKRYIYLSGSDAIIRGRKGPDGVHCTKTNHTVIIAMYEGPVRAELTASVVDSLGDYLKERGC